MAAQRWRSPQAQATHPHGNGHPKPKGNKGRAEKGERWWRAMGNSYGRDCPPLGPAHTAAPQRRQRKPVGNPTSTSRGALRREWAKKPTTPTSTTPVAIECRQTRDPMWQARPRASSRRPWQGPASPRETSTTLKKAEGREQPFGAGAHPAHPPKLEEVTSPPPRTRQPRQATPGRGNGKKCCFSRRRRRRNGQAPQHVAR